MKDTKRDKLNNLDPNFCSINGVLFKGTIDDFIHMQKICVNAFYLKNEHAGLFLKKIKLPKKSLKIELIRNKWLSFFNNSIFKNFCASCKIMDMCCFCENSPPITSAELFYNTAYNEDFYLPEIEWKWLKVNTRIISGRIKTPCIFLNPEGCSLGKFRSYICLFHKCDKFEIEDTDNKMITQEKNIVEDELKKWTKEVLHINSKTLSERQNNILTNLLSLTRIVFVYE